MILVATTMILRSQDDQVTASAQKATAGGLSAAETGITRFQSLINNNRGIASYKACDGKWNSDGTCPDSGSTKSWANATAISAISTFCSNGNSNAVSQAANRIWQDVDPNAPNKGQYRLRDYTYQPNLVGTNLAPGTGTLRVEGRVNQADANGDGDDNDNADTSVGTATTQLQISIPVQQPNLSNVPFPGMWVRTSVSTGNTEANVTAPCSGTPDVDLAPGYQLTRMGVALPPIPPRSSTYLASTNPDVVATITNPSTFQRINDAAGSTLPRSGDRPTRTSSGELVYEYSVGQITGTFNISPGQKVAIYLDGNIDMTGGRKAILHQCGSTPNCSPTDARIYGLSSNGQLNLGGNASICDVMFLAPTYSVDLNGGGQAQGCGGGANNNGIYWVNSWSGGGQGNHTSLYQDPTDPTSNKLLWDSVQSFLQVQMPPQVASISSWQRQETTAP